MSTLFHLALGNALLVTLLCVPAWLVARASRRPGLCHGIWLLVLLKLICPPLWEVSLPAGATPTARLVEESAAWSTAVSAAPSSAPASPTTLESRYVLVAETQDTAPSADRPARIAADARSAGWRWPRVPAAWVAGLAWAWLAGATGWLTLALARAWRFDRLVGRCEPAPRGLVESAQGLAAAFGLRRCPQVVITRARISPLLWAPWGWPTIVLPGALLERLNPSQQSTLVAHELAHFARGDHRLRWIETLVLASYWWLPAAWWARRKLSEAEEQCCDALVVSRLPERARAYASALLETVEFLADPPVDLPALASGLGTAFPLKRRFEMILTERRGAAAPKFSGRLAAVVALVALPLSPLGLRAWAEETSESSVEVAVTAEATTDEAAAVRAPTDDGGESTVEVAVGLELTDLTPAQIEFTHAEPVVVALADDTPKPVSPDVAVRIGKLEETLSGLLAELQALKAAHGLGGAAVVGEVVVHESPEGKVERKVTRIRGRELKVGGKPAALTLGRGQTDGREWTIVSPRVGTTLSLPVTGALSRRVIEFRSEGTSRSEALRKEREALEQRLKEIAAEEKDLEGKPEPK